MTTKARFGAAALSLLLGAGGLALFPTVSSAKKPPDAKPPAGAVKCGSHQHEVQETDPDEGSKITRCVCDEGWDAEGPSPPCKPKKDAKPAR